MVNKIKIILSRIGGENPKIISFIIIALVVAGIVLSFASRLLIGKENKVTAAVVMSADKSNSTFSDIVSIVGDEGNAVNIEVGGSWPGELISSEISQIQPQRQGVITDWRVNVGDAVSAGDILGKISAPPATPELIKMLAEQTEAVAKARAQAVVADEFAVKERGRLDGLKDAINSDISSISDFSFTALARLREKVATKLIAIRSFIERAISGHVAEVSNVADFRNFRYGNLNRSYGSLNQDVQNMYELALMTLAAKLKNPAAVPIDEAEKYFALAVRLANSS